MWVVELTATPLITQNMRLHHMARYRMRQQIVADTILLCRHQKIPKLERVRFTAVLKVRSSWPPHDAENWAPTVKDMIDGIVKAGVIPDDSGRYVQSVTYQQEITGQKKTTLALVIEEAA